MELQSTTSAISAGLQAGGLDADLLREMQDAGYLSDEDLSTIGAEEIGKASDEDILDAAKHLDEQEQREAIYAEQESTADLVEPEPLPEVQQPQTTTRKARTPRAASSTPKPRTPRIASASSAGAFVAAFVGDEVELTPGVFNNTAEVVDGIPAKKVVEKAVNFFQHFHQGKRLSVFTSIALDTLKRDGQISGKSMVATYMGTSGDHTKGATYDEGTARSQAQQIVTLFKALYVTTATGVANPDSLYFNKYIGA